jgi:hypothetical protein
VMNPKPVASLNHFTVPVAISFCSFRFAGGKTPPGPSSSRRETGV